MILISTSIPKSGSTLVCNYQIDVMKIAAPDNGQKTLNMLFGARYFQALNIVILLWLVFLSKKHGDIVVKTHVGPSFWIRVFMKLGFCKVTCCYRDPRDVVLSAIDHGKRSRRTGDVAFAEFTNVSNAIPKVEKILKRFNRWKATGEVLLIRYEDVVEAPLSVLKDMCNRLGWKVGENDLKKIIEKHERKKQSAWNFNKGTTCRWKTEMTDDEIAAANKVFKKHIVQMGYSLTK